LQIKKIIAIFFLNTFHWTPYDDIISNIIQIHSYLVCYVKTMTLLETFSQIEREIFLNIFQIKYSHSKNPQVYISKTEIRWPHNEYKIWNIKKINDTKHHIKSKENIYQNMVIHILDKFKMFQ
jgi:hypothetical protein